jgi:hypothetical protein
MTKPYIKKLSYATFYYKDEASLINHRAGGPAIEWIEGTKEWWLNGKRHRVAGPAYDHQNGYKEWWFDGEKYSEAEHKRLVKMMVFF